MNNIKKRRSEIIVAHVKQLELYNIKLVDLNCKDKIIESLLKDINKNIEYISVDSNNDYSKIPSADVILAIGILEYAESLDLLFKKIANKMKRRTKCFIFSYLENQKYTNERRCNFLQCSDILKIAKSYFSQEINTIKLGKTIIFIVE